MTYHCDELLSPAYFVVYKTSEWDILKFDGRYGRNQCINVSNNCRRLLELYSVQHPKDTKLHKTTANGCKITKKQYSNLIQTNTSDAKK